MQEVIQTGKTVEEAVEKACKELGLSRLEVNVDIIEMPIKKLFRTLPAKVRVTASIDSTPEFLKVENKKPAPPAIKKSPEKPVQVAAKPEKPAQVAAKPEKSVQVNIDKGAVQKILLESEEEKILINFAENQLAEEARQYIFEIFSTLNAADVEISAFSQGEFTLFEVESSNLKDIISIDGDVIQSLCYLIDRAANKNIDKRSKEYLKVRLDISGYRDKREIELLELAQKTAEEVLKTKRSKTLAPMNSYERLIIHTAIGEIEGLKSESIGADVTRRVVVRSTAPGAINGLDQKTGGRPRSTNDNRGKKPQRSRGGKPEYAKKEKFSKTYSENTTSAQSQPIVPKRREPITDGQDVPLYGKIEV